MIDDRTEHHTYVTFVRTNNISKFLSIYVLLALNFELCCGDSKGEIEHRFLWSDLTHLTISRCYAMSSSYLSMNSAIPPPPPPPRVAVPSILANVVAKLEQSLAQSSDVVLYNPACDPAFTARIQNALQKNFDYIRR